MADCDLDLIQVTWSQDDCVNRRCISASNRRLRSSYVSKDLKLARSCRTPSRPAMIAVVKQRLCDPP